jgi:hypothetical protein
MSSAWLLLLKDAQAPQVYGKMESTALSITQQKQGTSFDE